MNDTARARPGDYLGFNLAGEGYAIPINQVQEVISLQTLTPVPEAPSWLNGVFPLRGNIIPLIDLREQLGMSHSKEISPEACAVILRLRRNGDPITVAISVDEILDVADVQASEITPPPDLGSRVETKYLLGMRSSDNGRVTFILDMDRILDPKELDTLASVASGSL